MVAIINTALLRVYTAAQDLKVRLSEERGQDLIEYAMLGGLIALGIIGAGLLFVGPLQDMATGIGNCIDFDAGGVTPCDPF